MSLRLLAAALAFLTLAACGPGDDPAPFTDSRIPPALSPNHYPPEGWAWGLVRAGKAPAQRYGVATTKVTPSAQVLILTGYGESAEAWFETVAELNRRGFTVWVLERAGQGGSGRYSPFRDLGHAPSFDPDVDAVRAMERVVIRDRPLVVVGHGVGALVALRAVEQGLAADGLVLSSPVLDDPAMREHRGRAVWARRLGLGWLNAPGSGGWDRKATMSVQRHWQLANPDLRMGGPSLAWTAAFLDSADAARAGLDAVKGPVLALGAPCPAVAWCVSNPAARDKSRIPWIQAISTFVKEGIEARSAHQL